MCIIEGLYSLYTTDFAAPLREEIVANIMRYAHQCMLQTQAEDNCLNSYQEYLKMKGKIGSGYVCTH